MSAPPAPSLFAATGIVYRFQMMRFVRGKKLRLAVGALVVVIAGILATRFLAKDADPADIVARGFDLGFAHLLVYLLPFLFASGAIAEEVEGRTFTFLAGRPVGRGAITLGKYLAAVSMSAGLLAVAMLLVHLIALVSTPAALTDHFGETARSIGALALLSACYAAICLAWGAMAVEAAGVVAGLYLAVIEFGGALTPGKIRLVSMNYHAAQLAGFDKGGLFADSVPDVVPWVATLVLTVVTLLFVALAWMVVASSEFRFARA
jgi:ABC-type transport system involved in multi-copper enzyme maturation permease subunit